MSLVIQVCADCGAQQYPRRDVCGHCLSDALREERVSGHGTVLSWSKGHFSVLPEYKDKTPLTIARVKLDGGAVVIAMAEAPFAAHTRAVVTLEEERLRAKPAP